MEAGVFNAKILEATEENGFLSPATIAAVLNLEERLLLELLDRCGGEVYLPAFAEQLGRDPGRKLEAELDQHGTYILRSVPA